MSAPEPLLPPAVVPSLSRVIQWFKTMTTNEYMRSVRGKKWQAVRGKLWQRNYYEHIIRTSKGLERIREYILLNPQNWLSDRENPTVTRPKEDEFEELIRRDLQP